MNGDSYKVFDLFSYQRRYLIPEYQRHYVWPVERWHSLIKDTIDIENRRPGDPQFHWLGIFLVSEGKYQKNAQEYYVIDGQQRLVTLRLLLAALEHEATRIKCDLGEMNFAEIKVQDADRVLYEAAIKNDWDNPKWRRDLSKSGILGCYYYFRWLLWLGLDYINVDEPIELPKIRRVSSEGISIYDEWNACCEKKNIKTSCDPELLKILKDHTLQRLELHFLKHQSHDEEHAVIFDTLNGDRTPMEPLDHVRNSVFVRIRDKEVSYKLFKEVWEPLQTRINEKPIKRMNPETLFLYDYVICRGEKNRQDSINSRRGAVHFAKMTRQFRDDKLADFIRDEFSHYMANWPVIIGASDEADILGKHFRYEDLTVHLLRSIYDLTEGPATPAALLYLSAYTQGIIPSEFELRKYITLIEAYVARYILAGRPMSPLRSRFMQIMTHIDGRTRLEFLKEALKKDWPDDEEIKSYAIEDNPSFYEEVRPLTIGAILRGIERYHSGESCWFTLGKGKSEYDVEHIYPQNGRKWERDIKQWNKSKADMDARAHKLGNLTIVTTEHNSKVGNETLKIKQDFPKKDGFQSLKLNETWISHKKWTPEDIDRRTETLIKTALKHWKLE